MKGIMLVKDKRKFDGLNTRSIQAETEDQIIEWANKLAKRNAAEYFVTIINGNKCYRYNIKTGLYVSK